MKTNHCSLACHGKETTVMHANLKKNLFECLTLILRAVVKQNKRKNETKRKKKREKNSEIRNLRNSKGIWQLVEPH